MKLKCIQKEKSRHGKIVYYFRQGKTPRIRLPDDPKSPEFRRAHALACEGIPTTRGKRFASNSREKAVRCAMEKAIQRAFEKSKKRQFGFELTLDWIMANALKQGFKCALTRIPFYFGTDAEIKRNPYMPSIDRIDSKKGYTRDNVRIVIFAVNIMLLDWGEDVLAHVSAAYQAHGMNRLIPAPKAQGLPAPVESREWMTNLSPSLLGIAQT